MVKKILLSVGGNLPSMSGEPINTIKEAILELKYSNITVNAVSAFYKTPPFPENNQPNFINIAIKGESGLIPQELLRVFQCIEKKMGRQPSERWSARTLDIDLLAYEGDIYPSVSEWQGLQESDDPAAILPEPVVPHPRLHKRAFVLVPLMDIAPEWRHPVLGKTVSDMVRAPEIQQQAVHMLRLE